MLRVFIAALFLLQALTLSRAARAEPTATSAASESPEVEDQPADKPCTQMRFEWLVLEMGLGYRALDMKRVTFEGDELSNARLVDEDIGGFSSGLGVGVRIWFLSLMLRGDVTLLQGEGALDGSALWNADLEVIVKMLQGPLQPYFLIGMGYSALGNISALLEEVPLAVSAHGLNVRGGLGLDWYVVRRFSIGLRFDLGAHLLASKVAALELLEPQEVDTLGETKERLAEADGSLLGFSYGAALTFGLHLP